MKNIKSKEELKRELELKEEFFRKGSYVLVSDFRSNKDDLNYFLKNNIGQIYKEKNEDMIIILYEYEKIPKDLLSYFNYYGDRILPLVGKIIPKNRLSLSSDIKEELEEYLLSQKYNL